MQYRLFRAELRLHQDQTRSDYEKWYRCELSSEAEIDRYLNYRINREFKDGKQHGQGTYTYADESLDDAIKTEKFDAIADVLNALQEHDADLVDIIREMRQATGEGKPFNPDRLLDKIAFIGPAVGLDALVQSITVEITARLGVAWDEWYGLLLKFQQREGHCNVPRRHKEGELKLGHWVGTQRTNKDDLSPERHKRLEAIGFVWDGRLPSTPGD